MTRHTCMHTTPFLDKPYYRGVANIVFIPGVPEKGERHIFSTLRAESVI